MYDYRSYNNAFCIIIGLIVVYVPNIFAGYSEIVKAANTMIETRVPIGEALYSAFLYGTFQLSNIAVFVQHAKCFEEPKDAVKSMGIGFLINAFMMVMVVFGLMTVATNEGIVSQSVPTLFMVQNGVGATILTPLISVLIILGAVLTAVNMVAAMVKRICKESGENQVQKNERKIGTQVNRKEVLVALICCCVDFGIAQFGLLTLVQKAYSMIAYLAISVILVPYIIHMFLSIRRKIRKSQKQVELPMTEVQ